MLWVVHSVRKKAARLAVSLESKTAAKSVDDWVAVTVAWKAACWAHWWVVLRVAHLVVQSAVLWVNK